MELTRRDFVVACAAAVSGAAIGLPRSARAAGAGAKAATVDNLTKACANGSLAAAQCRAFAAKAGEEGYKSVAALFRAAEAAEKVHVQKYGAALKEMGSAAPEAKPVEVAAKTTKENLETVLKAVEANAVAYAEYVKQAQKDEAKKAAMFLGGTLADEASRGKLYKQAAGELDAWKEAGKVFIVCQVCAFTTMEDGKLKTCPVCSAPRSKFAEYK